MPGVEPISFSGAIGPVTTLPDGRIFTCYSPGDRLEDWTRDRPERWVYKRYSSDGGRTWTEPDPAFSFPAGPGSASSMLPFADRDGGLHVWSLRCLSMGWDKVQPWRSIVLHNLSRDGGRTWSASRPIDFGHQYNGGVNGALQMDTGRLLLPIGFMDEKRTTGRFAIVTVYSDDGGATWGRSNELVVDSGGSAVESGADEPVLTQLPSGLVWMVIRTQTGYLYESFSNDGATWTPPRGTRIVSSNAPAGVLRLRDGRLALFWNNLYGEPYFEGNSYARQQLHGAISTDEGQTWTPPKVVVRTGADEPLKAQVTYPFLCQAPDGAIVLVYHHIYARAGRDWHDPLRELVRVDPAWLAG